MFLETPFWWFWPIMHFSGTGLGGSRNESRESELVFTQSTERLRGTAQLRQLRADHSRVNS